MKKATTRRDFMIEGGSVLASTILFSSITGCSSKQTTGNFQAASTGSSNAAIKEGGSLRIICESGEAGSIGWPADMRLSNSKTIVVPCLETLLSGYIQGLSSKLS
jgi:hypothetical protein